MAASPSPRRTPDAARKRARRAAAKATGKAASRETKRELTSRNTELEQTVRALHERLELVSGERDQLLERAQHAELLQERLANLNERFDLLVRLSRDIFGLNLDKICEVCVTRIPYLLNAHSASVYSFDPHLGKLFLRKHSHHRAIEHVIDVSATEGSLMAQVVRSRKIRVFADLDHVERPTDPRPDRAERPHREHYSSRSCIVAPLCAGDEVLGVLNLSDPVDGKPFTEGEDYDLVLQIAQMLAIGMLNCQRFERLQKEARSDSLTGLANHQTFFDLLDNEVLRAARYGGELTVVMLDVDRFKMTNDTRGHLAGDAVLRGVAAILRDSIRLVDTAARYGGDEFALILPQSDLGAATVVSERIRERIARTPVVFGGENLWAHVSIGLAEHEEGLSAADFVGRADHALYQAKGLGGDRIASYGQRRAGSTPKAAKRPGGRARRRKPT